METTNKSQAERIKEALKNISRDITSDDKSACIKEMPIPQPTLWRYLNANNISDLNKGIEILTFFKKRISEREQRLQKAVA